MKHGTALYSVDVRYKIRGGPITGAGWWICFAKRVFGGCLSPRRGRVTSTCIMHKQQGRVDYSSTCIVDLRLTVLSARPYPPGILRPHSFLQRIRKGRFSIGRAWGADLIYCLCRLVAQQTFMRRFIWGTAQGPHRTG